MNLANIIYLNSEMTYRVALQTYRNAGRSDILAASTALGEALAALNATYNALCSVITVS